MVNAENEKQCYNEAMDTTEQNRAAWNKEAEKNNYWTRPVTKEEIENARCGNARFRILPDRDLPEKWTAGLKGRVLALASGGGQEGPLLAAMGCCVTVTDISDLQLERDRTTAKDAGLKLETVRCDLGDRFPFEDGVFDAVFNPISINFTPDAEHVWSECARVLKKGGTLITGFANPIMYMFDVPALEKGKMKIKYTLPFDSEKAYTKKQKKRIAEQGETMEFSHTLSSLIGGLCRAGFAITDLITGESDFEPVDSFVHDCYIALIAVRV